MQFSPQSKVWVYQSNRPFTDAEAAEILSKLQNFAQGWLAHGKQLNARAEIFHNFFIVLTVDQGQAPSTGCSIDASVRMLREIEQDYGLDLFNRFNMAYVEGDTVHATDKETFETLISIGKITPDTIVFNNMVQTLEDFETKWEVPFADSWHQQIFAHLIA